MAKTEFEIIADGIAVELASRDPRVQRAASYIIGGSTRMDDAVHYIAALGQIQDEYWLDSQGVELAFDIAEESALMGVYDQ